MDFKTIEEANKAYAALKKEYEFNLKTEIEAHAETKSELEIARNVAKEAIDKANEAIEKSDPNTYATVKGTKYIINFAVDGLTKQELKEDKAKLEKLVKVGSGALTAV